MKHAAAGVGRGQRAAPKNQKHNWDFRDSGGDLRGVGGVVAVLLHLARYVNFGQLPSAYSFPHSFFLFLSDFLSIPQVSAHHDIIRQHT